MKEKRSVFDAVKQIDLATGITVLTGQYVEYTRGNIPCVFPDHNDTNGSFKLYEGTPQKPQGSFYCFGCNRGGDLINFVKHYFNINDSREAAEFIAEKFNLDYDKPQPNPSYKNYTDVYQCVYDMIKYQQDNNPVKGELDFFINRKLDSVMDTYNLVYCRPLYYTSKKTIFNWKDFLHKKFPDIDPAILDSYGLYNDYGELVFSDRYLFPIKDKHGKIIGFSGRSLDPNKPKYYNTKETNHFRKNELLYNYDIAKRYDKIIVVEGYADALSLISVGIENVVAIMGSAFTDQQRALLKDKEVILSLDNDKVGRAAMYGLCLDYNYKVILPSQTFTYKDYNEALCDGFDLKKYIENRKPISAPEFSFVWLKDNLDLSDLDERMIMWETLNKICKRYNPVMRDYIGIKFKRLIKGKRGQ